MPACRARARPVKITGVEEGFVLRERATRLRWNEIISVAEDRHLDFRYSKRVVRIKSITTVCIGGIGKCTGFTCR